MILADERVNTDCYRHRGERAGRYNSFGEDRGRVLVATGLTNQEVAARLYLSRKTVEGHLARVFTKLGVKSRLGVAQRLAGR